jgi:hypothetical protein
VCRRPTQSPGIAATRVRQVAAQRRLEGAGIGRVELEDLLVRRRRIAQRKPPLLERCQVPQRTEASAHVFELLALLGEHTRERRELAGLAAHPLEGTQRRDVIALLRHGRLEERRRAYGLLVDLDQQGSELERHGLGDRRGRGAVDAPAQQCRQLSEARAAWLHAPAREHVR